MHNVMIAIGLLLTGVAYSQSVSKAVDSLSHEIQGLSRQEPVVLGLDSRLSLAEAMAKTDRALCDRLLADVRGSLSADRTGYLTRVFARRLAQVWTTIDIAEAERAIYALPRTSGTEPDARAQAYDVLIRYWISRDLRRAADVSRNGLNSGSFQITANTELLGGLVQSDPEEARVLFVLIVGAFPAEPRERDILLLLDLVRTAGKGQPALATEALVKCIRALTDTKFEERTREVISSTFYVGEKDVKTNSTKETLLFRAGALLKVLNTRVFDSFRDALEPVQSLLVSVSDLNVAGAARPQFTTYRIKDSNSGDIDAFDSAMRKMSRMSFNDALVTASDQADGKLKLPLLMFLFNQSTLSTLQRGEVAGIALRQAREAEAEPATVDALRRLLAFFKQKSDARSEECLSLLSAVTLRYCDCSSEPSKEGNAKRENQPKQIAADCNPEIGRSQCISLYNGLVKELTGHPAEAEGLAKRNVSLKSRVLLSTLREQLPLSTH